MTILPVPFRHFCLRFATRVPQAGRKAQAGDQPSATIVIPGELFARPRTQIEVRMCRWVPALRYASAGMTADARMLVGIRSAVKESAREKEKSSRRAHPA
jgi:hypothetical protein